MRGKGHQWTSTFWLQKRVFDCAFDQSKLFRDIFLNDTVVLLSKDGNKTYMKFTHLDGIAPYVAKQFRHCNASMVLVQQLFSHRVRLDHGGGDFRKGMRRELDPIIP